MTTIHSGHEPFILSIPVQACDTAVPSLLLQARETHLVQAGLLHEVVASMVTAAPLSAIVSGIQEVKLKHYTNNRRNLGK